MRRPSSWLPVNVVVTADLTWSPPFTGHGIGRARSAATSAGCGTLGVGIYEVDPEAERLAKRPRRREPAIGFVQVPA